MLSAVSRLLVLGAACAAAVEPLAEPAPVPQPAGASERRLESIVSNMAAGQRGGQASSVSLELADMVILDGQVGHDSRQLKQSKCHCERYRNGAAPGTANCLKTESGMKTCYPMGPEGCNREATVCDEEPTASARNHWYGHQPSASPGPVFFDAEVEEFSVYTNAKIHIVHVSSLPDADAVAEALASFAGLPINKVSATVAFGGAPVAVRSSHSSTSTIFASFEMKKNAQREALEAKLRRMVELPAVGGKAFPVQHIELIAQSSHPLVCGPEADGVKAESAALLKQLVQLKEAEVALMRAHVERASATCDTHALSSIAHSLGIDTPH